MQVPLSADLDNVIELLRTECEDENEVEAFVAGIDGSATVTLRALAADPNSAERLAHEHRPETSR